MAAATLKGPVNKTFTPSPYKIQRASTTDPVEMNSDFSATVIENSLWPQHLRIPVFGLEPRRSDCTQPEPKEWGASAFWRVSGVVCDFYVSEALWTFWANCLLQQCSRSSPGSILSVLRGISVNKSHLHPQRLCHSRGTLSSQLGFIIVPLRSQDFPSS